MSEAVSEGENQDWRQLFEMWESEGPASVAQAAKRHVARYPRRPAPWVILGASLGELSRYAEAVAAFRKAESLVLPERRGTIWARRGEMYEQKGDFKRSEKWYRRAIEASPRNADYRVFLGVILGRQGRFPEAKESLRVAIKLGTGATEEAHYNIGCIQRAEGRYRDAVRSLEKALGIDPNYKLARDVLEDVTRAMEIRADKSS